MLMQAVEAFISLMQALGYSFKTNAGLLRSFARFGHECSDTHVRTSTVLSWSRRASSLRMRDDRLRTVAAFARHVHAEDPRHEIPPCDVYGYRKRRPSPFILTREQVRSLVTAASRLGPAGSLRPETYRTLFGLLACTGLRISEALKLRLGDFTADGLAIRQTKFQKSRLVPLHDTAAAALRSYFERRESLVPVTDHVFVDNHGNTLRYQAVWQVFRKLTEKLGMRKGPKRLTLHSLRHTFVVRVLEQGPPCREHVGRYLVALSTYLGHVTMSATYWYVESTPELMRDISSACESMRKGWSK